MHAKRTRFADDIVAEFMPPPTPSNKVILLCSGMPGMPTKKSTLQKIAKKGFWVFAPRYRGSWESGGTFLDHSPHEDILDVVSGLQQQFHDLWEDGVTYQIENPEITIVGSSFGGPAAILCSGDKRVHRAICISGVVDWRAEKDSPAEPMDWLGDAVMRAFGQAYRFSKEDWNRLADGELYNPVDAVNMIDSSKLLFVHAKDDDVVLYDPVKKFADSIGAACITLKKGGHLGASLAFRWPLSRKLYRFIA